MKPQLTSHRAGARLVANHRSKAEALPAPEGAWSHRPDVRQRIAVFRAVMGTPDDAELLLRGVVESTEDVPCGSAVVRLRTLRAPRGELLGVVTTLPSAGVVLGAGSAHVLARRIRTLSAAIEADGRARGAR